MRLMLDLALNNTGAPISLKDVARRQEISDKYLEQIISVLNRAGYVRSVRGAQGGYLLRKAPEEYTVGMILRLTDRWHRLHASTRETMLTVRNGKNVLP